MRCRLPVHGIVRGVERLPIEVAEDSLKHSIRVGEEIDFEIEDVARRART